MATEGGEMILLLTRNLLQGGFNNYVNLPSLLIRPLKTNYSLLIRGS